MVLQTPSGAGAVTLGASVRQALKHSPELQALGHDAAAIEHDLAKARGNYRPSVDLVLGYGTEQHSDSTTRRTGATPSEDDWDPRNDASLRLTQRLYDGGETSQQVAIQEASLDAAHFRRLAAVQSIALEAVVAHLEVYRQRELVAVAQKNLDFHQDVYQLLAEREQAGAGNIADVTQTRARMARARSTLYISQADLSRGIANYHRVVGVEPFQPEYAKAPQSGLPDSLELALRQIEQRNPELLALKAGMEEADARLNLSRAGYKPKVNLELSSSYKDQLEGDASWQQTNDAIVVLRWNLYRGGQDRSAANAALSRKRKTRANRDDRLFELQEAARTAWASYASLRRQETAYREATTFSRETLDTYLRQFTISRRNLLDVLSAANEYAQSASQLITASVNQTVAAYRILKLGGTLNVTDETPDHATPEDLAFLAEAMVFPDILEPDAPSDQSILPSETVKPVMPRHQTPLVETPASQAASPQSERYRLKIGPCLTAGEVTKVQQVLAKEGLEARQTRGDGPVAFVRLLEGVYSAPEARERLVLLKKTATSAFILKEGGDLALYAGSFHNPSRAYRFAQRLSDQQIEVTPVVHHIVKNGTLLITNPMDESTAEDIADMISALLLAVEITPATTP